MRRVVISEIDALTTPGTGWRTLWPNLLTGKGAIREVSSFDTSAYRANRGAERPDFNSLAQTWFPLSQQLDRATPFALSATADASLGPADMRGERMGGAMATTSGEPREIQRFNDNQMAGHLERVGGKFLTLYPCHNIPPTLATALVCSHENSLTP